MNHARTKFIIAGLILMGCVGYLTLTGVASGWVYYVTVDELLADRSYEGRRVRLAGVVTTEGFDLRAGEMFAAFQIRGTDASVPVQYRGVVPTTFAPEVEVVVEGKLDADGLFAADVLLTKCASKYQAEEHAKRLESHP